MKRQQVGILMQEIVVIWNNSSDVSFSFFLGVVPCQKPVCLQYLKQLHLNRRYFNRHYNRCYCSHCYESSKKNSEKKAGSEYTIPRGWTSFGIKLDKTFIDSNNVLTTWYTTFYGTSKDKLGEILHNRFIPFPGDELLSGKKFVVNLPDQQHIYTSPSINFASLPHVCGHEQRNINGNTYKFQVVLQCKQNPAGIQKLPSGKPNACGILPDNDIKWITDQRSSVVPCSLLIRAEKVSA